VCSWCVKMSPCISGSTGEEDSGVYSSNLQWDTSCNDVERVCGNELGFVQNCGEDSDNRFQSRGLDDCLGTM